MADGSRPPLADALDELGAALADFEPCADFRLLRAARAVAAAAAPYLEIAAPPDGR